MFTFNRFNCDQNIGIQNHSHFNGFVSSSYSTFVFLAFNTFCDFLFVAVLPLRLISKFITGVESESRSECSQSVKVVIIPGTFLLRSFSCLIVNICTIWLFSKFLWFCHTMVSRTSSKTLCVSVIKPNQFAPSCLQCLVFEIKSMSEFNFRQIF